MVDHVQYSTIRCSILHKASMLGSRNKYLRYYFCIVLFTACTTQVRELYVEYMLATSQTSAPLATKQIHKTAAYGHGVIQYSMVRTHVTALDTYRCAKKSLQNVDCMQRDTERHRRRRTRPGEFFTETQWHKDWTPFPQWCTWMCVCMYIHMRNSICYRRTVHGKSKTPLQRGGALWISSPTFPPAHQYTYSCREWLHAYTL